jgi:hypothetical protein
MKNHDGMIRGFHWSNKARYKSVIDGMEVNFGMYDANDGGTTGEMTMKWHYLDRKFTPRLECFDDGWNALASFSDLIQKMGQVDSEDIDDEKFVEILKSCGFTDLTAYE